MIESEDHPEMVRAHKLLVDRLGVMSAGRRLDRGLFEAMHDVVVQHRLTCRAKGIDFPKLVAVVVPRLGIIEWSRADLDLASVKIKIVNFVRDHPTAAMEEVVSAFKAAWPHIKPDDFAAPASKVSKSVIEKAAKAAEEEKKSE